jgi:methyl coenzyme M reductase subunit D
MGSKLSKSFSMASQLTHKAPKRIVKGAPCKVHFGPETLKPVNRQARRAIKSGRKNSEKQSMEKSAAGSHD